MNHPSAARALFTFFLMGAHPLPGLESASVVPPKADSLLQTMGYTGDLTTP